MLYIPKIKNLRDARISPKHLSILQPKLTSSQQAQLMNKIYEISGESDGWKLYTKTEPTMLLTCDDPEKRSIILNRLTSTEACKAAIMRFKNDNKKFVIQVSDINFNKLISCTSENYTPHIKVDSPGK